jgi:tRNA A37 threonylcarbamoyladenosine dehydratase
MADWLDRSKKIIGKDSVDFLKGCLVTVFGIGGVGSFVVEGLIRGGIGNIILIDKDNIDVTNINRQIHANTNTIGMSKVDVMKERVLLINPDVNVTTHKVFISKDNVKEYISVNSDYIVDAVDNITAKIELSIMAKKMNIPIISSMGTGNKMDPTKFEVCDIFSTSVDPIAKVMRKELKKRDINSLKVVYSKETPRLNNEDSEKRIPGSVSWVPSVAGLIIVGEVIKDLLKKE